MSTRVRGNTLLEIWAIHTRPATKTWSSLCPLRDLDLRYLREIPCEMVPKRGLEPPRPDGHYTLNVARLPIPPLRHALDQEICYGQATAAQAQALMVPFTPDSVKATLGDG